MEFLIVHQSSLLWTNNNHAAGSSYFSLQNKQKYFKELYDSFLIMFSMIRCSDDIVVKAFNGNPG